MCVTEGHHVMMQFTLFINQSILVSRPMSKRQNLSSISSVSLVSVSASHVLPVSVSASPVSPVSVTISASETLSHHFMRPFKNQPLKAF